MLLILSLLFNVILSAFIIWNGYYNIKCKQIVKDIRSDISDLDYDGG